MTAAIFVSVITGLFGLASVLLQHKVRHENRKDHAFVAERLGLVSEGLAGVRSDVGELRADVHEIKQTLSEHDNRISRFEGSLVS